jgi:hypothetical protein
MTAGKEQHIPVYRTDVLDDPRSSIGHLVWRLATGTTVTEKLPVRALDKNFWRSAPFILP